MHSVVAGWLGLASPVHSGRSAVRGLAVFPQGHGLVKQDVYQFVGAGLRAGFAPLTDKDIYWALDCASPANGTSFNHASLFTFFLYFIVNSPMSITQQQSTY